MKYQIKTRKLPEINHLLALTCKETNPLEIYESSIPLTAFSYKNEFFVITSSNEMDVSKERVFTVCYPETEDELVTFSIYLFG